MATSPKRVTKTKTTTTVQTTTAPTPVQTSKKNWFSRMALWKKILLIAVVVIIAVFVIATWATDASSKVSDRFLDDIQTQKSDDAYELLSSGAKSTITKAEFKSVIAQVGPILNTQESMRSKEVQAQSGSQSTAKVIYDIKGTDGITYTFTNNLIKENGEWKILNFESKKQ